MRKHNAPAFQLYPKDFLSNPAFIALSLEERGLLFMMILFIWLEGQLPNDEKNLAKILQITPKKFRNLFQKVKNFFKIEDEFISSPLLDDIRLKQEEWRLKSSIGGQKSAQARGKNGSSLVEPNGNQESNQSSTLHLHTSIASASANENSLRSQSFAAPAAHSLSPFSGENDDAPVSTVGRGDAAKTENLPQRKEIFKEWKRTFDATGVDFHSGDGFDKTLWKRFTEGLTAEQMSAAIKGFAFKSPKLQTGKRKTNFQKIFGSKENVLENARFFDEQRRAERA